MSTDKPAIAGNAAPGLFASALEYLVDTGQRNVLFLDVMRQRGLQYREHIAETAPHVLDYAVDLIIDGRTLQRPVNYALVRVAPPSGVTIDEGRRPFVVIDPRAGHGPGIGGFKADSEIGVAMKAGHPCYFIGFLPEPMPGQTIEDVARAEAVFIEKVIALHPEADGKPCVIGNCQAGWAVMILASLRPELFGPIIVAGAPLSYWAGVRGKNPMRYSGGLLGGSWLTAATSDLGGGKFDGAWLVQNFENMNPSNTLWTKQYNVYSKVDSEADRYLEFERWWGGHVNLNAEEIQFIVDELFVGNNLAAGRIKMSDGEVVDLRKIASPIVVFCSKGDNITPPQQALNWILDLYGDVDEIRAYGQTIVYTVHETVGHLGIFVSGGVAKKEHSEFSSNIDLIDVLPPGLYEATFEAKSADTANPELAGGKWIMRCERRTLDDIRAMGGNTAEDERRFATAARVSEINLANYRNFVQPWIRATVTPQLAEWMRKSHPLRVSYEAFGNDNAAMKAVAAAADKIREQPEGGGRGQPVPHLPGNRLEEHRRCSRQVARHPGSAQRSAVSRHLRVAGGAGRGRHHAGCGSFAKAADVAGAQPAIGGAHRRVEIADRQRRSQGMRHPRSALCREFTGNGRRTEPGGVAAGPCGRQGFASHARAVQDDRARAVLHAVARSRGKPRRHPRSCCRRVRMSAAPAWLPFATCSRRVRKYPARPQSGSIA